MSPHTIRHILHGNGPAQELIGEMTTILQVRYGGGPQASSFPSIAPLQAGNRNTPDPATERRQPSTPAPTTDPSARWMPRSSSQRKHTQRHRRERGYVPEPPHRLNLQIHGAPTRRALRLLYTYICSIILQTQGDADGEIQSYHSLRIRERQD